MARPDDCVNRGHNEERHGRADDHADDDHSNQPEAAVGSGVRRHDQWEQLHDHRAGSHDDRPEADARRSPDCRDPVEMVPVQKLVGELDHQDTVLADQSERAE